jgi:hypothetical protein
MPFLLLARIPFQTHKEFSETLVGWTLSHVCKRFLLMPRLFGLRHQKETPQVQQELFLVSPTSTK